MLFSKFTSQETCSCFPCILAEEGCEMSQNIPKTNTSFLRDAFTNIKYSCNAKYALNLKDNLIKLIVWY